MVRMAFGFLHRDPILMEFWYGFVVRKRQLDGPWGESVRNEDGEMASL